jgi:hypothetical protein
MRLGFAFAGLLDMGPITEPGRPDNSTTERGYHVYGPGSGWLWRLDYQIALRVVYGFTLGAGFYYEQKRLSFEGQGDVLVRGTRDKVTSATDEYGGIFLTAGYVY